MEMRSKRKKREEMRARQQCLSFLGLLLGVDDFARVVPVGVPLGTAHFLSLFYQGQADLTLSILLC
jgi:hypothetical protein